MKQKVTGEGSARSLRTRLRILDAAKELLATEGPGSLSLRAVASRAKLSLSNLQFYYRGQAPLIRALLERELQVGAQVVAGALDSAPTGAHAPLTKALDVLLAQQRDVGAMRLYLALWSLAASHQSVAAQLQQFYKRYVSMVGAFLRAQCPTLSAPEARRRAVVAVAILEGAALFRSGVAGRLKTRDETLLRSALLSVLRGAAG